MLVVLADDNLKEEDVKNADANWPNAWISKAQDLGLFEDLTFSDMNKVVNREEAFTMFSNALEKSEINTEDGKEESKSVSIISNNNRKSKRRKKSSNSSNSHNVIKEDKEDNKDKEDSKDKEDNKDKEDKLLKISDEFENILKVENCEKSRIEYALSEYEKLDEKLQTEELEELYNRVNSLLTDNKIIEDMIKDDYDSWTNLEEDYNNAWIEYANQKSYEEEVKSQYEEEAKREEDYNNQWEKYQSLYALSERINSLLDNNKFLEKNKDELNQIKLELIQYEYDYSKIYEDSLTKFNKVYELLEKQREVERNEIKNIIEKYANQKDHEEDKEDNKDKEKIHNGIGYGENHDQLMKELKNNELFKKQQENNK